MSSHPLFVLTIMKLRYVLAALTIGILNSGLVSGRLNVLLLMMDDLRPNIEFLRGDPTNGFISPRLHTPNLDSLSEKSLVLKQAYAQQAICAPSRASLLTGRRPDTTRVYGFHEYWRKSGGNFTTIPQHFKQNGYTSIGMGKIFHAHISSNNNDPISWSVPYSKETFNFEGKDKSWEAIPDDLLTDKPLIDEQIADATIKTLQNLSASRDQPGSKPFFLAVGFHKPHLPFVFPQSLLEKYPYASIQLPNNQYAPIDMPDIAWARNAMFMGYHDLRKLKLSREINATIPDSLTRDLRRAYYCALTWADQQLGRVLDELNRSGFADDTIIAFLSDHGYQLGEHGLWTKFTNFDVALRTPMMIHIPGVTESMIATEQLVEFVDLFPTLVEAAGLDPLPLCPEDSSQIKVCREGMSFLPLVKNPDLPIKKVAFSQAKRDVDNVMGYSARTIRYRYTLWVHFKNLKRKLADVRSRGLKYGPVWRKPFAEELYDHLTDPEENKNVAGKLEYASVTAKLRRVVRKGFRTSVYPDEFSIEEWTRFDLDLVL